MEGYWEDKVLVYMIVGFFFIFFIPFAAVLPMTCYYSYLVMLYG